MSQEQCVLWQQLQKTAVHLRVYSRSEIDAQVIKNPQPDKISFYRMSVVHF